MKHIFQFFAFTFSIIIISSCNKVTESGNDFNANPSENDVFKTTIVANFYDIENGAGLTSKPYCSFSNTSYDKTENGNYYLSNITANKYSNKFNYLFAPETWKYNRTQKSFPLLPATFNYLQLYSWNKKNINIYQNFDQGGIDFQNGGFISFPSFCFVGPYTMGCEVNGEILDPTSNLFILKSPAYPFAKVDGVNKFLKSFGTVLYDVSDLNRTLVFTNKYADLQVPIPSSMLNIAPDSIAKWKLQDGKWVQSGYAKKVGNKYVTTVNEVTAFNFAQPEEGFFKVIKVRTDNGFNLSNATVKVFDENNFVLTEVQTNSNGEAYCFLPKRNNIKVVVYSPSEPSTRQEFATKNFQTLNQNSDITVIVNSKLSNVFCYKGKAGKCNGNTISNSFIILSWYRNYELPINNGEINIAVAHANTPFYEVSSIRLYDDVGNQITLQDSLLSSYVSEINYVNINDCPIDKNLYCHYEIDGVKYTINGQLGNSNNNPKLYGNWSINLLNNFSYVEAFEQSGTQTKGLTLSVSELRVGVHTEFNGATINGNDYLIDKTKAHSINFERLDLGGLNVFKGSADFYFLDNNVSKHLTAKFRVEKY